MKATKISPPPQPPATINIEMNEREAYITYVLYWSDVGVSSKTMIDKAAGIRDGDIPSPDVGECRAFAEGLYNELKNTLKDTLN